MNWNVAAAAIKVWLWQQLKSRYGVNQENQPGLKRRRNKHWQYLKFRHNTRQCVHGRRMFTQNSCSTVWPKN